jgi:hypothetical protein
MEQTILPTMADSAEPAPSPTITHSVEILPPIRDYRILCREEQYAIHTEGALTGIRAIVIGERLSTVEPGRSTTPARNSQ